LKRTITLKELPGVYTPSSLTLTGLCEYLKISEQHIKKWEEFFNLYPDIQNGSEKLYSKHIIRKFGKIKEHYDKGRPLKDLQAKYSGKPVVSMITPTVAPVELAVNPFENAASEAQEMPELKISTEKTESVVETLPSATLVRPFLTQLNKVNLKVERLLTEKARIIENTAIEKSRLVAKIEVLKAKNAELEREKDQLAISLSEKEQEVKKHFAQESVLGETLMITQEIFRRKEDEISKLKSKIEECERELTKKNELIQKQNTEIGELLEKTSKSWWKFWANK